eukprot:4291674-Pyramimonas_sp.AAC.1
MEFARKVDVAVADRAQFEPRLKRMEAVWRDKTTWIIPGMTMDKYHALAGGTASGAARAGGGTESGGKRVPVEAEWSQSVSDKEFE